jgi:THO complex subunit 1
LLRRLSRAEEAVFCGRVFIFLFQSFPLGDRSSVNPKAEFHTDNVTTFEESTSGPMEVDSSDSTLKPSASSSDKPLAGELTSSTFSEDELYPIFWTLQQAFSNPPRLFNEENFEEFKKGLESTLAKFKEVPTAIQRESSKGTKRKVDEMERKDDFATTFNPKYLTSRDLFSLEVFNLFVFPSIHLTAAVERLGIPTPYPGPSFDITGFPALAHRESKKEANSSLNTKSSKILELHFK